MRKMICAMALLAVSLVSVIACAQGKNGNRQNENSKEQSEMNGNKKVLVAYFSRTGENYSVGRIT